MARKVKYDFKPFSGRTMTKAAKGRARKEIKQFITTTVKADLAKGQSSVTGRRMPSLNKEYAKAQKGGNRTPNLKLEGDYQASFRVKKSPQGTNWMRFTTLQGQQPKADGHNNFTGKSKLPKRQSFPNRGNGEKFRAGIERGIEQIVKKHSKGE